MDKKYVVPDGMLMAARKRWPESATGEAVIRDRVEAALEWISENPIVPNHEQAIALCETFEDKGGSRKPDYCDSIRQVAVEWQKRMFLSPEEDDPDPEKTRYREALEKLAKLGNGDSYGNSQGNEIAQEALGIDKRNPILPQEIKRSFIIPVGLMGRTFTPEEADAIVHVLRTAVSDPMWTPQPTKAPDLERPEEVSKLMFDKLRCDVWADEANHRIAWAYRLGMEAGSK